MLVDLITLVGSSSSSDVGTTTNSEDASVKRFLASILSNSFDKSNFLEKRLKRTIFPVTIFCLLLEGNLVTKLFLSSVNRNTAYSSCGFIVRELIFFLRSSIMTAWSINSSLKIRKESLKYHYHQLLFIKFSSLFILNTIHHTLGVSNTACNYTISMK